VKNVRTFVTEQSPEAAEIIAAILQLSNEWQEKNIA
jgi:hypothetical protein